MKCSTIVSIKDLEYADDICLFAKDMDEMKLMTELVLEETKMCI